MGVKYGWNTPKTDIVGRVIDAFLEKLLSAMVNCLPLENILEELNSKSSQFSLGRLKGFLLKILDNKKYGNKILMVSKKLIEEDITQMGIGLFYSANKGIDPKFVSNFDGLVYRPNGEKRPVAYGCGHGFLYSTGQRVCLACQSDPMTQITNILTNPKLASSRRMVQPTNTNVNQTQAQESISNPGEESKREKNARVKGLLRRWDNSKYEETNKFLELVAR